MNLLRLINPSLAYGYCSNLVSNHSLIRLIRFVSSRNLQVNYAISFLFCLDLILHAYKILIRCDRFGFFIFTTKQGPKSLSS